MTWGAAWIIGSIKARKKSARTKGRLDPMLERRGRLQRGRKFQGPYMPHQAVPQMGALCQCFIRQCWKNISTCHQMRCHRCPTRQKSGFVELALRLRCVNKGREPGARPMVGPACEAPNGGIKIGSRSIMNGMSLCDRSRSRDATFGNTSI